MNVNEQARSLELVAPEKRTAALQEMIGEPVDLLRADAGRVLHDRALLVTKLSREGIWPARRREDDGA